MTMDTPWYSHQAGGRRGRPDVAPVGQFQHLFGAIGRMAMRFRKEREFRRAMEDLSGFDERLLRDIGLTRGSIEDAVRGHGGTSWAREQLPGEGPAYDRATGQRSHTLIP